MLKVQKYPSTVGSFLCDVMYTVHYAMTVQEYSSNFWMFHHSAHNYKVKVKQAHYMPGQTLRVPGGWGSQISRQSVYEGGKVVRPSTGRLYLPGNIPGTHFCYRMSRPQGHRATEKIKSITNSNDTIGNRTRDLPACSAVPQTNCTTDCPLTGRLVA